MAEFVPMALGGVGFDTALNFLKLGYRTARRGWNGRGMWLRVVTFDEPAFLPYIQMRTVDDCLVPWLASQTDLLAHDWIIFDGEGTEIAQGVAEKQAEHVEGSGAGILGNQ